MGRGGRRADILDDNSDNATNTKYLYKYNMISTNDMVISALVISLMDSDNGTNNKY